MAEQQRLHLALPLSFVLFVSMIVAAVLWKRRSNHSKWIQRKRYFDDDAFVVNGEGLELIDEPTDLPPVD